MSFEIGGDTVVLEFEEGTILAGATVRCRMNVPIRKLLALQHAFTGAGDNEDAASLERIAGAWKQFGDEVLTSWNITTGGKAVPATGEGMLDLPFAAAQAVFQAWNAAIAGNSGNSGAASTNGSRPRRQRSPRNSPRRS